MSKLTLQEIIAYIKQAALDSGFVYVSEKRLNLRDASDTQLPSMHIKNINITYDKLINDASEEMYTIELQMIEAGTDDPLTNLKTLQDTFLGNLLATTELKCYTMHESIRLITSEMSNDIEVYEVLGAESTILTIEIDNTNKF
jgi:hypothetical protein